MRYALPIIVLLGLIALLALGLTHDPREVPSPLIGKPAPAFDLPVLGQTQKLGLASLKGRPQMINFFASWCAACRDEHPLFMRLAQQGVEIIGMDYKDTGADGQRWLNQHGNPYRTVLVDAEGKIGLDFGVYGVPETFILDAQGVIVYKHIGAVTEVAWREKIAPLLGRDTEKRP